MSDRTDPNDRLLSVAERAMVAETRPPGIATRSKPDLQALAKRLREARDRARRIGAQQKREMRGKAAPKGAAPARANAGTEGKAQVLIEALQRVTQALKLLNAKTSPPKPIPAKRAPHHPPAGRTAIKGMQPKPSTRPTVRSDPREIGRVSRAVKVAQAKRDRRP